METGADGRGGGACIPSPQRAIAAVVEQLAEVKALFFPVLFGSQNGIVGMFLRLLEDPSGSSHIFDAVVVDKEMFPGK